MKFIRPLTRTIKDASAGKQGAVLKKYLITVAAGVLLFLLYGMIFAFSAQDAEESGSVSRYVSEKCVEAADILSGRTWTEAFKEALEARIEHPIRKLAHFSEYACMGILVYTLWRQWKRRGRGLYLLTVIWVFLSAAGDELHQYFIPGRWASPADVLLDTCGGVFGMLMCIFLESILERKDFQGHFIRRRRKVKDTGK